MKPMHYALALSAAIAVAGLAATANPAAATAMADCNKQWNDATAAKTTNGATYQDFLKACLKKSSTSTTAATTTTTTMAATDTAATTTDPAAAKAKKACNAEWKAMKDAGTEGTQKKKEFVAACMVKAGIPATDAMKKPAATTTTTAPAATTTTMAKPATTTTTTPTVAATTTTPAEPTDTMAKTTTTDANGKPKTPGQLAMDKRIKECGAEWKKAKADNTTNGLKWPQFWSQCDKKLKAAAVTQ